MRDSKQGATAQVVGGLLVLLAGLSDIGEARAAEQAAKPSAARPAAAVAHRGVRVAAARPLTIRRHVARPLPVVAEPAVGYLVPQHDWNDPRLYYFGPFRTGGEVFYGDQAGDPITRGNAGLGQIAGYGGARGGFGGPHFDAVGGFHNGPGPDAGIDAAYASGSVSRPDYGDIAPRYASVTARVSMLNRGIAARGDTTPVNDRVSGSRLVAEGRGGASFGEAKARFSAPMNRNVSPDAAISAGGVDFDRMDGGAF